MANSEAEYDAEKTQIISDITSMGGYQDLMDWYKAEIPKAAASVSQYRAE